MTWDLKLTTDKHNSMSAGFQRSRPFPEYSAAIFGNTRMTASKLSLAVAYSKNFDHIRIMWSSSSIDAGAGAKTASGEGV